MGKLSRYVTGHVNSAFHPSGVGKLNTSLSGWNHSPPTLVQFCNLHSADAKIFSTYLNLNSYTGGMQVNMQLKLLVSNFCNINYSLFMAQNVLPLQLPQYRTNICRPTCESSVWSAFASVSPLRRSSCTASSSSITL